MPTYYNTIVFESQYFRNSSNDQWKQINCPLSGQYMKQLYTDYIRVIKRNLPNALISWDISPWLSEKEMTEYWNYFKDLNNSAAVHLKLDRIN